MFSDVVRRQVPDLVWWSPNRGILIVGEHQTSTEIRVGWRLFRAAARLSLLSADVPSPPVYCLAITRDGWNDPTHPAIRARGTIACHMGQMVGLREGVVVKVENRFGLLPAWVSERLALPPMEDLKRWMNRGLPVDGLDAVFSGD